MLSKSQVIKQVLFTALWIRLTWGFITDEIFTFLDPLSSFVYLLFDAVIVVLGIVTLRKKCDFIVAAVAIAFTAWVTIAQNSMDILFYANGLRDFIAYIFIIPILRHFMSNEARWQRFTLDFDKFLFAFLVLQVPCLIWQYIAYGAGDHGGGSLGNWNSGIISTLIYVIDFYLLQKRINPNQVLKSISNNMVYVLLLIPTFLNETKISFIFLVMFFLLLIPINLKMLIRLAGTIPVLIVLLWGGMTAYVVSTGGYMGDVFTLDYYIEGYLMAETDDSEKYAKWLIDNDADEIEDIPRFTKLILLSDVYDENPGKQLSGFGIGHFKGGTIVPDSDFFNYYKWLMIGSIPYAFHIIVQLGFVGLIVSLLFFIWLLFHPQAKRINRNPNTQLFILITIVLLYFYNDSIRNAFMMFFLFYVVMQSWCPGSITSKRHNTHSNG
ncbi:MAG: hypothetical protein IJ626_03000 [Muribaculaceae bacterium]|nr:hypothetical protein [Muribaculaceae bacterium]